MYRQKLYASLKQLFKKNTMAEAAPSSSGAPSSSPGASNSIPDEETNGTYDCNICLDIAKDTVVTFCGHLFCWPCLHQWLSTRPDRQMCPVCKAGISKEKVIPIYGRGSTDNKDPREKLPPRPSAQRSEPENNSSFGNFNMGNLQFSFGIGAFPFTFFASNFNLGDARPGNPSAGTQQHQEERVLSQIFLFVAMFFAIWLIIA
ncbi:RNF185 [Bugula neritina]|uniref:RING-type E3 ubiquitin transferase n=1 Tax=Bugula neritina TaxID=10212 RepID=A0A7J7JR75_BUGNE|nr:RNF185 [Bugula neritina]